MRPDFKVLADSRDITAAIRSRLISLTVTDEAGFTSDTVEICLDDADCRIALPRHGVELDVSMGYVETGLVHQGVYTVDEVEPEWFPWKMTIRGKAADMRQSLKAPRTTAWSETTVGAIVREIAGANGLGAAVDPTLAALPVTRADQTGESDIHFLTRLAQQCGALAKPAGGKLVFVPAGKGTAASGQAMPSVTVRPGDTTSGRATLADRGAYGSVVASWYDPKTGRRIPEQVGTGEPTFPLRDTFNDPASARRAAESRKAALDRGTGTLSFDMPGNPRLAADARLTMVGFRAGVSGEWVITKVTHAIEGAKYTTKVEAEAPK